jgi:hypothetical protein
MRPSLQMQQSVDKQIQDELAFAHAMCRCLSRCFSETDYDFAVSLTSDIREHVRDVVLTAKLLVEGTRFRGADKGERHFPAR